MLSDCLFIAVRLCLSLLFASARPRPASATASPVSRDASSPLRTPSSPSRRSSRASTTRCLNQHSICPFHLFIPGPFGKLTLSLTFSLPPCPRSSHSAIFSHRVGDIQDVILKAEKQAKEISESA